MTEELFREDAYLEQCDATVVAVGDDGIELDRTVFYATGGGQPGDTGILLTDDGREITVTDTIKGSGTDSIVHVLGEDSPALAVGDGVVATIDWSRRHRHMRMHTCLHLLCSLVDAQITGASLGETKGRIDFNLDEKPDKESLEAEINCLIGEDHAVTSDWIDDAELEANPEMIRTMSVKPPMGKGRVRLINVDGTDLQPCGGTHVKSTGEIGPVRIGKIENKGKQNRRINVLFDDV
jgi:misacylated tRNA(Ala) deacylase